MVVQHQRWRGQSLMLRALRTGDLASLVDLLDSGLDCDQTFSIGGWSRPAVCIAVEQGHTELVSELCRRRCSLSVQDQAGLTPLQLAASLGLTATVRLLLANRADVDVVSGPRAQTALHLATAGSHQDVLHLLLETPGCQVDRRDSEGRTSLMYAAHRGSLEIIRTLLRYRARTDLRDRRGNTALLLHCSSLQVNISILDLLSGPGLPGLPDLPNRDGWWPLLVLVSGAQPQHNKEEAVRCLLGRGADVNMRTFRGPVLHTALVNRNWEVCSLLVRAGAEVSTESLYLALLSANTQLANIFLAAGAPCSLNTSQR